MDYGTRAKENFLNGYNCCQAVFLACTDGLGAGHRNTGENCLVLRRAVWAACGRSAAR